MKQYTTITKKGQVTIPADIRRQLGLKPGQAVRFEFRNGEAVVKVDDWRKNLAKIRRQNQQHMKKRGLKPLSNQELDQAINQAARSAAKQRYTKANEK